MKVKVLVGIGLGVLVGYFAGPRAEPLGEIGLLVIKLLKALALPLVFLAVLDSLLETHIPWKRFVRLALICLMNGTAALGIALGISYFLPIHEWINMEPFKQAMLSGTPPAFVEPNFLKSLKSFVPESIVEPFAQNNVISIVFLAILFGVVGRRSSDVAALKKGVRLLFNLFSGVLGAVVHLVPIAVFGVVAKAVGTTGFTFLPALLGFTGLISFGLFLHVGLYYPLILWFFRKITPIRFFRSGSDALLTGLSTGSSLATVPVTLHVLENKFKVSRSSARLAACIGTNLNNDGILLYEAATALFLAHVMGMTLSVGSEIQLVLVSVVAAVGIAGVPDAGLITLSLVLSAVGLPLAAVPLLLPVDWLIGRLRALTNVAADMIVALLLEEDSRKHKISSS